PMHIGIIMDGNGRWAKKRRMPRNVGHRAGAEVLKKITTYADEIGIKAITAYTFSTENWKRPQAEIDGIMALLREYLLDYKKNLGDKNAVIKVIGDRSVLDEDIIELMAKTEEFTKDNTGVVLCLAINYGGQDEIVRAVNKLVSDGKEINAENIEKNLYTSDLPPVDLIIRPSGEKRLSNFLLWQAAYAEFWYDDILWPDFTIEKFNEAIIDFQKRNRRFGGV
ncbi:MAG: di-trans,poly-cis-decaprenylcistransferase, partial [Clostridia bacterium]|nr:di-trans,poly-cis-decaprenylcistransferase [Clostridia bacterium]